MAAGLGVYCLLRSVLCWACSRRRNCRWSTRGADGTPSTQAPFSSQVWVVRLLAPLQRFAAGLARRRCTGPCRCTRSDTAWRSGDPFALGVAGLGRLLGPAVFAVRRAHAGAGASGADGRAGLLHHPGAGDRALLDHSARAAGGASVTGGATGVALRTIHLAARAGDRSVRGFRPARPRPARRSGGPAPAPTSAAAARAHPSASLPPYRRCARRCWDRTCSARHSSPSPPQAPRRHSTRRRVASAYLGHPSKPEWTPERSEFGHHFAACCFLLRTNLTAGTAGREAASPRQV